MIKTSYDLEANAMFICIRLEAAKSADRKD